MSRAELVAAAKLVGVKTTVHERGKSGPITTDYLRISLINRLYGPGYSWKFAYPAVVDAFLMRAVECCLGKYGYLLGVSQFALRNANEERAEYKRLTGLKRRRPKDEAALLRSARHWLEIARVAQGLHEVESGINNRGTDGA